MNRSIRREIRNKAEKRKTNIGVERVLGVGGFGGLASVLEEEKAIEVALLQIHGRRNLKASSRLHCLA